jgi:hypothetical protein
VFKRSLLLMLVAGALLSAACSGFRTAETVAGLFNGDALIAGLTNDLGIDARQAAGGVGSILSFAKSSLAAADYATLARLLPAADDYLEVAREAGLLTIPITNATRLSNEMGKLGFTPTTATKLYSELGGYLGEVGGPSARDKLMNLL